MNFSCDTARLCDFKDCKQPAFYKAPQSYEQLRQYYWFCLHHVRLYNAAWNFGCHMDKDEIQFYQQYDGQHLTWKREAFMSTALYNNYVKNFSDIEIGKMQQVKEENHLMVFSGQEQAALKIFQLTSHFKDKSPTYLKTLLKERYYFLVKKYHPDRNQGCKRAEEQLKKVIQGYRSLKQLLEKMTKES